MQTEMPPPISLTPVTPPVTFNIKLERNSKGYNWEITIIASPSVAVAIDQLTQADNQLKALYTSTQ